MAYITSQQSNTGSYVRTTQPFNVNRLLDAQVGSEEFKQLIVELATNVNEVAQVLNNKISGYYLNQIFNNGKVFFNPNSSDPLAIRPNFIKVIPFGALPNTAAKTVAHGITVTNQTRWTFIGGIATDPVGLRGYPIPNTANSTTGISAAIDVDATNVTITTSGNLTAFSDTLVILEFLNY